ncbi:short-chain dehydrogenase/reductase SDR [Luminiphilus syltensis NOR5-1B]|uniref:Short-chain dehydrogenase/reductase SDR n=1 Tax=Luminiphilus syltensis NOR5-1B TaxID=565045 RepID=B8KVE5_9GAMM|nr:short-chain dehydrogenase/reductase SDR [Luminiphilus syltensis NOR5-1B]
MGPGNGRAFAQRFVAGGYQVALCARRQEIVEAEAKALGEAAAGYVVDATDDRSMEDCFRAIEREQGPIDTLIYNAGNAKWGTIDDIAPAELLPGFDVNVAGLVRATQSVLPGMRARGTGNIIVVGAGAALRGRPATLGFAAAKAAQRSAAQSLARQLGPEGIHVALLILDGVIDIETTMARMSDKPKEFFLAAAGIADAAFTLTEQDKQAWTFELDLRPYVENW